MKNTIYILIFLLLALQAQAQSSFSGERLNKACENYVYNLLGNDIELRISKSIQDQVFDENDVTARCTGSKESLHGNCFIGIEFILKDRILRRIEVPIRVTIFMEVPVAVENIKSGEAIESSKVSLEKKDVTFYSQKDLPKLNDIVGLSAAKNISKGTIITNAFINQPGTIKRGDKVNIVVQSAGVVIRTMGEALIDAKPGENIRVKRDGTQAMLQGQVAMDGTVYIITK